MDRGDREHGRDPYFNRWEGIAGFHGEGEGFQGADGIECGRCSNGTGAGTDADPE